MKRNQVKLLGAASAVLAVLFVGSLLLTLSVKSGMRGLERDVARLRKELSEAKGKSPKVEKPADRSLEQRLARARDTLQTVQKERDALRRENKALKRALAHAAGAKSGMELSAPPAKPIPGTPMPIGLEPTGRPGSLAGTPGGPVAPPPIKAPPPAPRGEPWGPSTDNEMDELAAAVKLTPEQREEVKQLIMNGQDEFERRLIEAGQTGVRDISAIEEIGQEVSKQTEDRINQLLYPEQRQAFGEYMRHLQGEDEDEQE
ncbi:hypothetical protein ACFL59_10075 [Planctomycetota bacterium]